MNIVQVAENKCGACAEAVGVETAKSVCLEYSGMYVGHARRNVAAKLELMTAFGNFDRADFSGPLIDVLKQMPVNCAKMSEIERPRWHGLCQPLDDELPLHRIERTWIAQT